MLLKEVLTKSIQFFKDKKIESARLDAELLISHALKIDRISLYVKYEQPLNEAEVQICREYVRRRSLGESVAYITEEKGFFGEVFKVLPGVLVPRPETEHVVEEVLKFIEKNKIENPRILDLGAGSGCIGLSILKQIPTATLVSVDISKIAIQNIKLNLEKLNLQDRAVVVETSVENIPFEDTVNFGLQAFDCIVSNPPYIDVTDTDVDPHVRKFEPATALFAENKGLLFLQNWSKLCGSSLKKPGIMAFEMGHLQGPIMFDHFESLKLFSEVSVVQDLSGKDRIIVGINK
ncbi:MAG: peptide chain release factor N(5)-glutamine methyltransferase [Moraxellaceae bacterium]|nr:peptide chain release factor N(5)-glutamine methyltransferase [Pseudobdellovibrionaceae bacterium]